MANICSCDEQGNRVGGIGPTNQKSCFSCRLAGFHSDSCTKCNWNGEEEEKMLNTSEGTQRRIDNLARPEHFVVTIHESTILVNNLSYEEFARLSKKLPLVVESARRLCAAMVKGTLKYDTEDLSLQEWFNHLRDEAIDQVNYTSLMEESVEKASTSNS